MIQKTDLPQNVQTICNAYVQGLIAILGDKLHGVYMYGAAVFEDAGRVQDIDCHVILQAAPTASERERLFELHEDLERRFPSLGGEVDAFYILLEDAKGTFPPENHLRLNIRDESWALHCAHVRAGQCVTLYGPKPTDIFPEPTWDDLVAALAHELKFITENLQYPDYCVLNLCRIIYSFLERDVVVSKRFCGKWACDRFPQWASLIEAAMWSYEGDATLEDEKQLKADVNLFYKFAINRIQQMCGE